ncbi:NADH-ubiquinone oxidoreductase chain 5 [Sesamum angolense]|uniref:NADH-ubiquinone oxidoreductase chain 5 n=1 Tax=Sesamum angolense TaxID=2727404 RepID=A0AAE1XG25_9LAMI|nr:NADH-ubiquinone oxidoreductase chain 5 [Sesamum angolense]
MYAASKAKDRVSGSYAFSFYDTQGSRCSPLFEYPPTALIVITFAGAMTSFLAATTGILQNDLKRVIAYSTCSQLGYMIFACGISNYSVSVFHLMNRVFQSITIPECRLAGLKGECQQGLKWILSLLTNRFLWMANNLVFTGEELAVDECLGYPKAYAKLCRDRSFGPFSHGPPFTFTPYALPQSEDSRAKELDDMFPTIDPKAKPTTKPKIFLSLLWKQLNHLGNAGFDPEIIRVDPYGNVLYYHADAASPLAWEIDHWFPCSRGGLTVPCNLRILQWQVCKRKHNKLEFLIPWWDFQMGISINQFLSIFASSNSDFRRRAFSWLFSEGECEELNASQTVDSHTFPQHFLESKGKLGLAPAAVVLSRRESFDALLKSVDVNRRPRSSTPIVAVKKMKQLPKENEDPLIVSNPYQAIVMARDSLKQREETAKMQAEIQKLDNEVGELQHKTEEEKLSIQELELVLIKKRRRAEKCRRLAESQSSYRTMLEKMIRDAMHQSVVYKEQVRLNQAAASALLARLEAQKAICDSAERELHRKYKQRDELERQIRPEWEQARKRTRMDDALMKRKMIRLLCICQKTSKRRK